MMARGISPIDGSKYRLSLSEDEAEIGGDDPGKFEPILKCKRWGGECYLAIEPAILMPGAHFTPESDKLTLANSDIEFRFYGLEPTEQFELGIAELEIVFLKRPATNKIVLNIESQGLTFSSQPALTKEDIDEGTLRPDNIVGSYAVYHSSKKGHALGRTNYMAGKAFHVPRPRLVDSLGWGVWADQVIEKGQQIITIPQGFLDAATYPVYHVAGDTFGYTSIGGTSGKWVSSYGIGTSAADPYTGAAGTGRSMSMYMEERAGSTAQVIKYALYKDSDDSFVAGTEAQDVPAAFAWVTGNFSSPPSLEAVDYNLVYWLGEDAPDEISTKFDDIAPSVNRRDIDAYGAGWPDPIVLINMTLTRKYSAYCTYTMLSPLPSFRRP